MSAISRSSASQMKRSTLLVIVWGITVLVSLLPDIIFNEWLGMATPWLLSAKLVLLALVIFVSVLWKEIHVLRDYFIVLLAVNIVNALTAWVSSTPQWYGWFADGTFAVSMAGAQALKLGAVLVVIGVMLVLKGRRQNFFFEKGNLTATAERVPWLGMARPTTWKRFGPLLALCIGGGTLVFLLLGGAPSLDRFGAVVVLLPLILLFAAVNALNEEMLYRAAPLATLHEVVGKSQAMLLVGAYFGFAHYYGVPYGVVGVLMSGVLGWLMGKSILESKGFFWAWAVHLVLDVLIFIFMAAGFSGSA
ncbi:MAG: CPBP family intramembrane glutamic endopeptidase [Anaerolineae bacterium]